VTANTFSVGVVFDHAVIANSQLLTANCQLATADSQALEGVTRLR
jgi:hypothetical protein